MTVLGIVAAVVVLLGGVVGYIATGDIWLLAVAAVALVASTSGWVLTRGGSRQR